MRILKPTSVAIAVIGILFVATANAVATPVEIADISTWTATSQTGAGFVSFVASGTAFTPFLNLPIDTHPNEFAVFEQIGPDRQTLVSPSFAIPPSPTAPSGSLQPVTFTWLMANDNYAMPPLHGPQEVRVAVTSSTGDVFELFRGDDGPANPHAPTLRTAVLTLSVGEGVEPSAGSVGYRILVENVATDNFNILTVSSFNSQLTPVPEPTSIIFLSIGAAGLAIAAGLGRRKYSRSDNCG
jgi:hypothetical protein